jgi:hypothetical protein
MPQTGRASTAKAPTGKSALSSSNPKTPVQMKGAPKPSGASKGRPRKNTGKENKGAPVSPSGGEINAASLVPSSDEPTGEDTQTSVADENRILRERLAKAECELDVLVSLLISHTLVANLAAAEAAERKRKRQENEEAMRATAEKITTLVRPKGEAGNAKKGFNLQEAMGLNTSSDKAVLYNEIMVRHN